MRQQWGLRATALAATATALVGCSVGGDDADASETGESSAVPAPQKLLALDEFAALNALTLGVKPDTVFATLQSQAAKEILQSEGIEVVDKPTFFQSPDVEQIAAVHPDRILLSDVGSLTSITVQANEIAPTTVLAYAAPWREVLNTAATGTGVESPKLAKSCRGSRPNLPKYPERSRRNRRRCQCWWGFSGGIYTVIPQSPMSSIIEEAGFGRPASRTRREDRPQHRCCHVFGVRRGGRTARGGRDGRDLGQHLRRRSSSRKSTVQRDLRSEGRTHGRRER